MDSLIVVLESKMAKRVFFDKQKEENIRLLNEKASKTLDLEEQYFILNKIIQEYEFYSFDKALEYIEKNIEIAEKLNNNLFINKTKLSLSLLLIDSGRYKESIDALNEIKRDSLPNSLINEYYIAYKEGYSGLSYYTSVVRSKALYSKLYTAYQDSLYLRLDPNSEESLRLKEKQYRDKRQLDKALKINSKRLEDVNIGSREFSLITFERSLLYELKKNIEKQKEYLILSAISDIEASVKDNASIGALARIMFLEDDIDRAHRYINFSFEDAEFYNSKLRFINIANSLPMITKAYGERSDKQKVKLKNSLIFISFLAGFLLISIYLVYKQVKKLSVARNKLKKVNEKLKDFNSKLNISNEELKRLYLELSESDKIKEHYIGTFLNLYSEYIDKLDVYRKLVRKYIVTNKTNDLLELTKSKQVVGDEIKLFYKNFDESFLHIYPNFIKDVNELLESEGQLIVKKGEVLNTELRILALIRLGITSSSKISKILRYSVNTIYNYRVKVRNTAIGDRNSFEEMIKNIG
ncbi:DUF6377 domain-containing protein [Lacinutrix venerupis]|uniref:DUF6377 domain-containing protein n=1 Tax=Lacinutrix venerupis TaxID=1486034 RepID=UPI0014730601|nr:DUF6377 domain-containing protein [Lacinutrix venerupis]